MSKLVEKVSNVIAVSKEAYMYLNRISRMQRGCKPLSEEQEDKMWVRMYLNKDGMKDLDDHSLGGGIGLYDSGWTSWDVETLKKMLDEGGFTWVDRPPVHYIPVSI